MAVDVSRIPNNNKFDPVREAILELQTSIDETGAAVGNGTLTIDTDSAISGTLTTFTANQSGNASITIGLESTIPGDRTFSGNIVVSGNFTVNGTTTYLNTQQVEVEDNIIELNRTQETTGPDTATASTSGIQIYRGNGVNVASLIFDDADDTWDFTDNVKIVGDLTVDGTISGSIEEARTVRITVKNTESVTLAKGTVVHVHPSATPPSGNVVEVKKADYDTASLMPAIGILNEALTAGSEGKATMFGYLSGIDTSSFSAGDELYVGNNGALTNTKPTGASQLIQKIAVVIKSDASNGSIEIFGAGRSNDVPNLNVTNASVSGNTLTINRANASDVTYAPSFLPLAGGSLSGDLELEATAPGTNDTSNASPNLTFTAKAKQSDGTAVTDSVNIYADYYSIANRFTRLYIDDNVNIQGTLLINNDILVPSGVNIDIGSNSNTINHIYTENITINDTLTALSMNVTGSYKMDNVAIINSSRDFEGRFVTSEGTNGALISLKRDDDAIVADETLGQLVFYGQDTGGTYQSAGRIKMIADDTWDATFNQESRLEFWTHNTTTEVQRLIISTETFDIRNSGLSIAGTERIEIDGDATLKNVTANSFIGPLTGNADTADWADEVDVNANDTFNGTYSLVWHDGDTLYRSSWLNVTGSTDTLNAPNIGSGNVTLSGDLRGSEADSLIYDFIADGSYEGAAFYNPDTFNAYAGADHWASITLTNAFASDRTSTVSSIGEGPFNYGGNTWSPYFNAAEDEMVIEIDHTSQALKHHAIVGIQFTNTSWRANRIKIEAYNGTAWSTGLDTTSNTATTASAKFSLGGAGIQKLKITLGDPQNSTGGYIRISKIFGYDYQGVGSRSAKASGTYYIEKYRDNSHYSNIYPETDSTYSLGTNTKRYSNVYSDNFVGTNAYLTNITSSANSNIYIRPDGTGNVYFGISGNGSTIYHYSKNDDGIYTIFDHTTTQSRFNTTGTAGFRFEKNILVNGDVNAVGASFTNPVTIYDVTATENPRLSLGRQAAESLRFDVGDRDAIIYHKQDETDGVHTMQFAIDSGNSEKRFIWYTRAADGTSPVELMHLDDNGLDVSGSVNISGSLFVDGTIDLSDANLDIGSADIIFGIDDTDTGARGLVWNFDGDGDGTAVNIGYIRAGGTLVGEVMQFNMNADGSVTGNGTIYQFMNGGTDILTVGGEGNLSLRTTTNGAGSTINFSDHASGSYAQQGNITYYHVDTASYGSGNAFVISGNQSSLTVLADGKLMFDEGLYIKPSSGTGAGTLVISSSGAGTFSGITSTGNIDVRKANVGIITTYSSSSIEDTDAQLDLISSSDGAWGSAINLVEGSSTTANTDVWSIARQTTGGTGDSGLHFNFGTTNAHNNTNRVKFSSSGDITATGDLSIGTNDFTAGTATIGGILLQDSADRSGVLEVNRKGTSSWSGIQINHADRHWSFIGDDNEVGVFDDHNGEWIWHYAINNDLSLYYNGVEQARTQNGYFLATNEFRSAVFRGTNTAYHVTPAGTSNLNALTLGGTLELNQLTNDFTSTTALVNSGSGVVGQRSLGSLAFLSSVPSHTHDDRYYTESEIQTFFNRGYINSEAANNLPVGWYTIATNTGDRALGEFQIWDTASSDHQSVLFNASHHFGVDSSNDITVLANSRYSGTNFRYIRIKDGGTYDGAALQVYVDGATNSVNVAIVGGNAQSSGWVLKDWIPDATDPGDLTNYSSFGVRCQVDLDLVVSGGIITTGKIYSGGDTSQFRVLNTGDEGSGNGLDADLLDGQHASSFASSSHTHSAADITSGTIADARLSSSVVMQRGGIIGTSTDWNTYTTNGVYGVASSSGAQFTGTGRPITSENIEPDYRYGSLVVTEYNGYGIQQTYYPHSGTRIFTRTGWNNGGWQNWHLIWTDRSDGSGSGLDADTVDGLQASQFLRSDTSDTMSGDLTINPSTNYALYIGRMSGQPNIKSSDSYAFMDSNGGHAGLNWYTSDNVTLANGGGSVAIGNSSITQKLTVHGTVGATIYYDKDNTSYYVNPNSTGTSANFAGKVQASQVGVTNIVTNKVVKFNGTILDDSIITDDGTNVGIGLSPIYKLDVNGTLGVRAGTIQTNGSTTSFNFLAGSAAKGAKVGFLLASNSYSTTPASGVIEAQTDMRSPIYYDSNNTGYYMNPAGTSYINEIKSGEAQANPRWDTAFYVLQAQHWYGDNSSQTMYIGESGNTVNVRGTMNFSGGHGAINITNSSILSSATSAWTGNPGGAGKIQYHSNRWYIVSDSSSNRIVQFRRDGSDKCYIDNDGRLIGPGGNATGDWRAPIFYDSDDTNWYVNPNNVSNLWNLRAYRMGITNTSSTTRYGISLYGGEASGEPTYGLLFTGTSLGTHGSVTGNWATYFTMNNDNSRGWIFRRVGSGNCASISGGGTASFNGDVIAYYSDMRLKTKLGDIEDPIGKIQALNGFYYEPNEVAESYGYEKETRVGLSAQEVEAVLPEIVTDAPIGDGYKTVDYAKLVPVLVEAIKEQQKQIDELKSLINK